MRGFAASKPPAVAPSPANGPEQGCHFTIAVDQERALVRATLGGFFTVEAVERFARAELAAVESLTCAPHQHRVLIDASQGRVHSKEVAEAFARIVTDSPLKARRIAVVSTGAVHRMQTRRILEPRDSAMFETLAEAEAWIAEDDEAPERLR